MLATVRLPPSVDASPKANSAVDIILSSQIELC